MLDHRKYSGPDTKILDQYRNMISEKYNTMLQIWPLLSGNNSKIARFKNWIVVIFEHVGINSIFHHSNIGELP